MTKQEKLQLLEELVKEGRITLCQAFELSEPEKEYVYPTWNNPWVVPEQPNYPWGPHVVFGLNQNNLETTLTTRS